MFKSLKALAKSRELNGALSGRQIAVGSRMVKVERLLGEGGFATIYRCTDADTGEVFALKHFILTGYPEAARDADQEVAVMERLSGCPCVVRLHEAALAGPPGAPTAAFALMDYCPETLVGFLQQRSWRLEDEELLRVALPVARAVQAMHSLSPPLAHRDLKVENVLRAPSGRWVLCDFGSCSARHGVLQSARDIALEEEVVRKYTTPAYRAPELYDLYAREYVGPPVDIWALGVLLYLLAFGRLPFEGEAKLQVLNGRYTMPEGRAPALRALIADMLRVAPRERPTIHDVLPRLAAMAPPHLLEEFPDMRDLVAGAPQAAAAASGQASAPSQHQQPRQQAAAGWASAQHERVPSQGWADFAAESSPPGAAASSVHARQESGSGSWATFSPKRGEEAQTGAPTANAGSFWSSFGEEVPGDTPEAADEAPAAALLLHEEEESASPKHQTLLALREAHVPQQPPPQQPHHHSHSAPQRFVAAAAAAAASVASVVTRPLEAARTPAPARPASPPAPASQPVDANPLSAGLSRMSRVSQVGEASVAKPPAPTPSTASAPAPAGGAASAAAQRLAGLGSGPTLLSAGGARQLSISEAEALRQHSLVLEELLESRKEEIERLQRLVEQQGSELKQLRQQLHAAQQALREQQQQQQQQPRSNGSLTHATPVQSAGAVPSAVAATPASSRLGQAPRLELPGSSNASGASSPSSRAEASPWTSFSAAGGERDAPTPTLLQPASGSTFAASSGSSRRLGEPGGPAAAGTGAGAAATPASAAGVAPLEEQLRSKLDLGLQRSGSSQLARAASGELQRLKPMRSGSGVANAGVGQQQQHAALRSFPVPLTPGTSMLSDGPRSAPPSAQPSPLRAGPQPGPPAAGHGTTVGAPHPTQPGSPMHSVLSAARSGSPGKHRRHLTAPDGGFFQDLNPLQH